MHPGERVHSWGKGNYYWEECRAFFPLCEWTDRWEIEVRQAHRVRGEGCCGGDGERKGKVNEKGRTLLILSFLRPFPPQKRQKKTQSRGYHLTQDLQVLSVWLWRSNNAAATCARTHAHTHTEKKQSGVRVLFQEKKGLECAEHLLKWAHCQYSGFQEFQVINLSNLYSCQPQGGEREVARGEEEGVWFRLSDFCRKMLRSRHQHKDSPICTDGLTGLAFKDPAGILGGVHIVYRKVCC